MTKRLIVSAHNYTRHVLWLNFQEIHEPFHLNLRDYIIYYWIYLGHIITDSGRLTFTD